jgi:HPt (histidine-containing phosphotransfer) domain-containing protein
MAGVEGDEPGTQEDSGVDEVALADLQRLFAADQEQRLLAAVLGGFPRRLADMRAALGQHDAETLSWGADALRGAADLVGARRLGGLCTRLADTARSGGWEEAGELVEALDREYSDVRLRLEAELQRGHRSDEK